MSQKLVRPSESGNEMLHCYNVQQILRVVYLATCFCLLFTAFSTARSYLTTVFPTYGFYSFFLMYIGFVIGSIVAVPLCQRLLLTRIMFFASLGYLVFLAIINTGSVVLFLFFSLTLGISAGIIWVAQASYLVRTSNTGGVAIGKLTAIFFAIWSISSLIGSSMAILAIRLGLGSSGVFWVMTGVCAISCTMFYFVVNETHVNTERASARLMLRRMIALVPKMPVFLLLYGVQQGMNLLLSWAVLPTLVSSRLDEISLVIVTYSVAATTMSYMWGYIYDHFGLKSLLFFHCLNGILVAVCILSISLSQAAWQFHMISGFVCGSYDQCNNNMITTLVKGVMADQTDIAVGIYRVTFSLGVVVFSIVALHIPYYYFVAACLLVVLLAFSSFLTVGLPAMIRKQNSLPLHSITEEENDDNNTNDDDTEQLTHSPVCTSIPILAGDAAAWDVGQEHCEKTSFRHSPPPQQQQQQQQLQSSSYIPLNDLSQHRNTTPKRECMVTRFDVDNDHDNDNENRVDASVGAGICCVGASSTNSKDGKNESNIHKVEFDQEPQQHQQQNIYYKPADTPPNINTSLNTNSSSNSITTSPSQTRTDSTVYSNSTIINPLFEPNSKNSNNTTHHSLDSDRTRLLNDENEM